MNNLAAFRAFGRRFLLLHSHKSCRDVERGFTIPFVKTNIIFSKSGRHHTRQAHETTKMECQNRWRQCLV